MVWLHRDLPTIVRVARFQSVVERQRLPWVSPHYFLRLGFECALTDRGRGRLILYYPNVPQEDARLMVYDIGFRDLAGLRAEASRRLRLLEEGRDPARLPPCPSWMASRCQYQPRCGCGG